MASASLLALLDDVATVLDDVATMTKVAGKKTAGLLGDDLAVNAEKVTGVSARRELGVIWEVAKGGALNKVILIPAALAISALVPWLITPLLMIGGFFLCYEGTHKVFEKLFHPEQEEQNREEVRRAFRDPEVDMEEFEEKKIKGAIRTDFILSAEIIVIALQTVTEEPLTVQLGVLIAIAVIVNVGVYGLVAGIVRLDDVGLDLARRKVATTRDEILKRLGQWILRAAPWLMKTIGVVGTVAMFLVGGGIIAHGVPPIEHFIHDLAHMTGPLTSVATPALNGLLGLIAGALLLPIVSTAKRVAGGWSEDAEGAEK